MAAINILPPIMVIRTPPPGRVLTGYYMNESPDVVGYVGFREDSVFNPFSRIEVEVSSSDIRYVHLRFFHTNMYWGRRDHWDNMIVASSTQPVEDRSNPACTLFEPIFNNLGFLFTHVHTGRRVRLDMRTYRLFVSPDNTASLFTFVDWETLTKLPSHITFKGFNDMYLRGVRLDPASARGHPYHQLSGNNPNHLNTAYQVFLQNDGHVRIKSEFYDRFWRRSPDWIWGDSNDSNGTDRDTLFWPVKLNDNTIALRNAGNNRFCMSLTADGKTNCLNAGTDRMNIDEARFEVEELVLDRSITSVRYRMDEARIYDAVPFLAGSAPARNNSDTESTLSVRIAYRVTTSTTFTYSYSLMVGVSTTITAGVPFIAGGGIEISSTATHTFEFGHTHEETREAEATYTTTVPPRSQVEVNYVGTRGRSSVPFSYVRRDRRSSDGTFITTQDIDGVFQGVNTYNFDFEELPPVPL